MYNGGLQPIATPVFRTSHLISHRHERWWPERGRLLSKLWLFVGDGGPCRLKPRHGYKRRVDTTRMHSLVCAHWCLIARANARAHFANTYTPNSARWIVRRFMFLKKMVWWIKQMDHHHLMILTTYDDKRYKWGGFIQWKKIFPTYFSIKKNSQASSLDLKQETMKDKISWNQLRKTH